MIAEGWPNSQLVKEWYMYDKHPQFDVEGVRIAAVCEEDKITVVTVLGDVKTAIWAYRQYNRHVRQAYKKPKNKSSRLKKASNY